MGLIKETTYGTDPGAGYIWLPCRNPAPQLDIKMIDDVGYRGLGAELFGSYQGVQDQKFSYELDVYETDTHNLIPCILGPDTKTGTATPFTHTFNMAAAEPKSYTLHDYDGIDEYAMSGAYLSELTYKLDSEGALTAHIAGQSFPQVAGSKSGPTFTVEPYYLGWQATLSIGGSGNVHLVSAQFGFKRKLTVRWTAQNSQVPSVVFVGPISCDGKLTFDVESDSEFAHYTSNDQPSILITLAQPSSTNQFVFQATKSKWANTKKIASKEWLQVDTDFSGIYNTTDAGPGLLKAINAQSTAY